MIRWVQIGFCTVETLGECPRTRINIFLLLLISSIPVAAYKQVDRNSERKRLIFHKRLENSRDGKESELQKAGGNWKGTAFRWISTGFNNRIDIWSAQKLQVRHRKRTENQIWRKNRVLPRYIGPVNSVQSCKLVCIYIYTFIFSRAHIQTHTCVYKYIKINFYVLVFSINEAYRFQVTGKVLIPLKQMKLMLF